MVNQTSFYRAWLIALACFVLAGASGAWLRFGLLYGFPEGILYTNLRHAHSHFMYFGWVTPALMSLIGAHVLRSQQLAASRSAARRPLQRRFLVVIGVTFVLALLAFFAFLAYGYQPVEIGGRRLPLAVIASSLNMLAWYAFAAVYWHATWRLPRNHALRLWDSALIFLILASLGAWGIALARPLQLTEPIWPLALAQLFLDLFASAWFVLALLGLAYAALPAAARQWPAQWGEGLLIMGLPVIFLLNVPADMIPPGVRLLAGIGGLLVSAGLLANVWALWPAARQSDLATWRVPLIFLGVKAIALLVMSVPAGALWAEAMALKVSYLHWLLLGFVTLGLVAAVADAWGPEAVTGWRWLTAAVLLLFLSLIPLTRLWPLEWSGRWAVHFAAWVALGPVVAAAAMLLHRTVTRRSTLDQPGETPAHSAEIGQ
jgi:hypothetical protein